MSVCMCIPHNVSFYMRCVSYQRKIGDQFFPELLVILSSHLRLGFPIGLFPSDFSTRILSSSPNASYMLCPFHPSWLDHSNYIWRRVKVMKLIMKFNWAPCHHGMSRPRVVDIGDGLQIWRAAAYILNKQLRTPVWDGSPAWGIGRGTNNSSPQKKFVMKYYTATLAHII
jgi:hypothetical protein